MDEIFQDSVVDIRAHGELVVAVWSATPTPTQLQALAQINARVAKRFPGKSALFDVVVGSAAFAGNQHGLAMQLARACAPMRRSVAHVVLVPGPARAFFGAMLLQAPHGTPARLFDRLGRAADWLALHVPGWSAARIVAAVEPTLARAA